MFDPAKGPFNGRKALLKEGTEGTSRFQLVGLDIEGNIPAESALIYYKKGFDRWEEAGHVTAAMWSPTLKKNIALASVQNLYATKYANNLYAEIYVMRELVWQKLMVKVALTERPFLKLARRTANPPWRF